MLDVVRHFFPLEFVKKLIDNISIHHINRLHLHLTDTEGWRFPVKEYPWLEEIGQKAVRGMFTNTEGFYSKEDLKELIAFATARGIEILPEVDFPYHAGSAIKAYPGLNCPDSASQVLFCAGNDEVLDFASAVFDSLADIFPSPYVHFGGDEAYWHYKNWENCPKCKKRIADLGLKTAGKLQSWLTCKLAEMLGQRGKTAIGWDDVLDDSETFPLPENVAVMSYRGTEGGVKASNRGRRVIMSPENEGCYFDYKQNHEPGEMGIIGYGTVAQAYQMDPVKPEMTDVQAKLIMGGQGNLWTEAVQFGKHAEYMTFPRICALSEALWTPRIQKDFGDFKERLKTHRKRLDDLGILQYCGTLE
jgi:hexosaminidase